MDGDESISGAQRPLRLRLGVSPKIPAGVLIPQRIAGSEAICGGIEYRVLCVSTHADLPLSSLIALPAALDMVTDQGQLRSICGLVTQASAGDSDGGLASYQLVLTDAFSIMEKRCNTRVFRRLTDIEIVKTLLDEWIRSNTVLAHAFQYAFADFFEAQTYPQREFVMQHNESDAAFVRRLLKRSGVAWFFRAEGKANAHAEPAHTLVLFNHADGLRKNLADTVRYHADRASEERDTLTSWSEVRKLQAGKVTRHSWNEEHPRARPFMTADALGRGQQGMHGNAIAATLDDYRVLPPRAGNDHEALCQLGMLAIQQHDYESHCFHAEGSVRDLCPGEYFSLAEHPGIDALPAAERDFVVTSLQVAAQNNLPRELAVRVERLFARNRWLADDASLPQRELAAAVDDGPLRMQIELTAVRRGVPIVPAYDTRIDLPSVTMQSAVVVGPPNEEVHCDAMGRVKVRFPATRALDHQHAGGTGAAIGRNPQEAGCGRRYLPQPRHAGRRSGQLRGAIGGSHPGKLGGQVEREAACAKSSVWATPPRMAARYSVVLCRHALHGQWDCCRLCRGPVQLPHQGTSRLQDCQRLVPAYHPRHRHRLRRRYHHLRRQVARWRCQLAHLLTRRAPGISC